ncbi:MAG: hypothetical protein EBZ48_01200 [Proteobacteria bacterium]|nr:hypothetical protein [Pseudomonadota bacterium]
MEYCGGRKNFPSEGSKNYPCIRKKLIFERSLRYDSKMDGDTLRSRVAQLVQRTRKAVRLYSSAERLTGGERSGGEQAQFTALQLEQWQQINTELQRQLAAAIDHPNQKMLAGEVVIVRDRFYHEWRNVEAEVHVKQAELLSAAEKSDFVRCAVLGKALVVLKAREQAAQAAHHELQELVDKTRVEGRGAGPALSERVEPQSFQASGFHGEGSQVAKPASEAPKENKEFTSPVLGKVIPLRRQGMLGGS